MHEEVLRDQNDFPYSRLKNYTGVFIWNYFKTIQVCLFETISKLYRCVYLKLFQNYTGVFIRNYFKTIQVFFLTISKLYRCVYLELFQNYTGVFI